MPQDLLEDCPGPSLNPYCARNYNAYGFMYRDPRDISGRARRRAERNFKEVRDGCKPKHHEEDGVESGIPGDLKGYRCHGSESRHGPREWNFGGDFNLADHRP